MADTAEVSTHFRIPIMSGQSSFAVRVPRHHLENNRKFYFSQLNLVPDFFSKDAQKQQLDADPEMETIIEMDVHVKINYGNYKTVYMPEAYVNSAAVSKTIDAIAAINDYFETHKPDFAVTTPIFIDWVDIKEEATQEITEYVPEMAPIYYGEEYDETEHFNFLPNSVRGIETANNFRPPLETITSETAYAERVRLRFWMAPFTRAVFSSKEPFATDFGFMVDQIGTYNAQYKQYHLNNDTAHWKPVMVGKLAPKLELTRKDFRMAVIPTRQTNDGNIKKIQMVRKDWYDDAKLTEILTERFKQTMRFANIVFTFGYDETNKKFFFNFPESDAVNLIVQCEPELTQRLGFGTGSTIIKGMQALPQEDNTGILDAKKKALTVVYDTGPILCTLDQMSSNTTSGALDHYMAALYPHESGILSMPPPTACSCTANLTPIHPLTQTSAAYVPVVFRLLRIYEDQSISDFAWKCKGYIYGVLQGTCKKV